MTGALGGAPGQLLHDAATVRRALTLLLVLALHLLVVLALLWQHEVITLGRDDRTPFVVTLLPDSRASKPRTVRSSPPAEAQQATRPATPPSPNLPQKPPLPITGTQPRPVAPPLAAASPAVAAGSPVEAGEEVFNIDTGAGAGGPGFSPPRWIHKVTDDEFFPLVDEELLRTKLEVELQMLCTVALDARLTCEVQREWPVFVGVRRAVRQAVPLLRMAPPKRDGHPIANQRVTFLWRITIDRLAQFAN